MRRHTAFAGVFSGYVKNNKIALLACTAVMILGICVGSAYCVSLANKDALKEGVGGFDALESTYNGGMVLFSSLTSIMQLAFFVWLCGCAKIGIVFAPIILSIKGFACGFCISSLVSLYGADGLLASVVGIFPQMIFVFALLEVLCIAAINQAIYSGAIVDKMEKRRRFVAYCIFCSLVFSLFALCSLFEAYISPHLLIWALEL